MVNESAEVLTTAGRNPSAVGVRVGVLVFVGVLFGVRVGVFVIGGYRDWETDRKSVV